MRIYIDYGLAGLLPRGRCAAPPNLKSISHRCKSEVNLPQMDTARAVQVALEATQGQILSQSATDATRFWWHLHGS